MDPITIPQPAAIILLIIFVLVPTAWLGDWYAVRIKEHPLKKTWPEVVIGFAGSEFFICLMSDGIFWILGVLYLVWWVPFVCAGLVYGITGGCQVRRQEQKIKSDKEKAQGLKTIDDVKLLGR